MTEPRVFTIGHSNHSLDEFLELLASKGVTAVADVRSAPFSRFCPQFNRDALSAALNGRGIRYTCLGRELGGRSADPACYHRDGQIRYELVARTSSFRDGLARIVDGSERHRIALMCAEKEPLDCHRTLLVAPALTALDVAVAHILADGEIEPHEKTMDRLLEQFDLSPGGDLFESREELIEGALRRQAQRVAFVAEEMT